jgi:hypothetical protein
MLNTFAGVVLASFSASTRTLRDTRQHFTLRALPERPF